ncbi:MAG: methylenetetrahydrofolate reductase C-terminal domain-containing protein [Candidatus Hydrothermarchaeaceae archaeon]
MIIVEQKKIEELAESLEGKKNVLIVGCNGCVGIHQQGGERQAEELAELFKMDKRLKGTNPKTTTVLRQCDKSIVKDALSGLAKNADAILSMACGAGVQVVAEAFDIPALPAHNTSFIGVQERESDTFYERCIACGNCILQRTGGICPVARCPKSHMNGPCGGVYNGKCETDKNRDCAWILIYNRLKNLGELDRLNTLNEPKDFSKKTHPRSQEA